MRMADGRDYWKRSSAQRRARQRECGLKYTKPNVEVMRGRMETPSSAERLLPIAGQAQPGSISSSSSMGSSIGSCIMLGIIDRDIPGSTGNHAPQRPF
jgi:hypothetical protein